MTRPTLTFTTTEAANEFDNLSVTLFGNDKVFDEFVTYTEGDDADAAEVKFAEDYSGYAITFAFTYVSPEDFACLIDQGADKDALEQGVAVCVYLNAGDTRTASTYRLTAAEMKTIIDAEGTAALALF